MYIKGIGKISKEKAMSILTSDGIAAVKSGDITLAELGEMCWHPLRRLVI